MSDTADPASCRYGGRAVTKITSGGVAGGRERNAATRARADVGRQRKSSLLSSFAGHTDNPVVPVDILHREGCGLCCPEAEPAQQQQDGAVTTVVGARLVHRGQHPLHLGIGEGAGQSGVLPFADGRHGARNAGRNHAVSGQEAKKRTGGRGRVAAGRLTKLAHPDLHERRDRRHGEAGPIGRRRSRALGKKGCGVAPVHPPGPDDQAMRLHEVIVEALQPLLGLAWRSDRDRARRYPSSPQMRGQQTDTACHIREPAARVRRRRSP